MQPSYIARASADGAALAQPALHGVPRGQGGDDRADQKPTPSARVHPDDRRRGEGLQALGTLIQGAPQPQAPLSYYTPILIQCTLPHSDPKVNPRIRKNGDFSLIVLQRL